MKNTSFLNNFIILASGTAIAQAVPALASPILTRMYSPEDFGLLALFSAIVATFAPAVCGRYEVALMLPKSNEDGLHLYGIAIYFSLVLSMFLAIGFLFKANFILNLLNAENLKRWILLVPFVLFFTGLYNATSYFSNRYKNYKLLSQSKIIRSLIVATISIFLGINGFGSKGLLLGYILGLLFSTLFLIYKNQDNFNQRVMRWGRQKKLLIYQYRDYPLYNGTTGFLNGLTLSLPVFFLSHYFPESIVGYFALVIRLSRVPVNFISASISQLHLKKVVDLVNEKKKIIPYLIMMTTILTAIVFFPSLIIIIWAPKIVTVVFGENWIEAGRYAQILMPAIAVRFVVATLSTTIGATNNSRLAAIWRITAFVTTAAVFSWYAPRGEITIFLYAVLINDIVLYAFFYFLILYAAMKPRNIL